MNVFRSIVSRLRRAEVRPTTAARTSSHSFTVAWVLVAVADSAAPGEPEPGSLEGVLAGADAYNHALLAREELEHGVRDLLHAGLISVQQGFALTKGGEEVFQRAWESRGNFVIGSAEKLLKAVPCVAEDPTWSVTEEEFDAAADRYGDWFVETLRGTEPAIAEKMAERHVADRARRKARRDGRSSDGSSSSSEDGR